jgi:N-acetylneuraminate synthase
MIINNRTISNQYPPYIIAELSANHNGDIQRAFDSGASSSSNNSTAVSSNGVLNIVMPISLA